MSANAITNRLLVLINIALIPYVWVRFPRETGGYVRACFATLLDGKRR